MTSGLTQTKTMSKASVKSTSHNMNSHRMNVVMTPTPIRFLNKAIGQAKLHEMKMKIQLKGERSVHSECLDQK